MKHLRTHYRAIFISDAHLGFRGANAKQLLAFLKSVECEYLYLVGDIFDLWEMSKRIWWNVDCTAVLHRILKMAKSGTKIVYVPGNHDEAIRTFLPFILGPEFEFVEETSHTTATGVEYGVIHGDQFDGIIGRIRWLCKIGNVLYGKLLMLNSVLHHIRVAMGFHTYWSLAGFLKHKAKKAVSFMKDFETSVVKHAKKHKRAGIICGHIHHAKVETIDGIIYANCGDWVESLTALVENAAGEIELIHWHDLQAVGVIDVA